MFTRFVVLFAFCASMALSDDKACEEIVTSEIKMKLVRDSLNQVKDLYPRCRDADEDPTKCSKRSTVLGHMNLAIDTLEGLTLIGSGKNKVCPKCPDPIVGGSSGPVDCQEILNMGNKKSGIYTIYPRDRLNGSRALKVYCDMDTEGGGWTVIQRRGNYSVQTNFHQDWETYKKGFGSLEREFWLGNDNIFTLTNQAVYTLRVDLKRVDGEYRYSQHNIFFITDEKSEYVLYIEDFVGNVSNEMRTQHKSKFSTKDRQNDKRGVNEQCAYQLHGAWWYVPSNNCGLVNINGLYMPNVDNINTVWWWGWTGHRGLLSTEMKIRPRNFESKRE